MCVLGAVDIRVYFWAVFCPLVSVSILTSVVSQCVLESGIVTPPAFSFPPGPLCSGSTVAHPSFGSTFHVSVRNGPGVLIELDGFFS